MKVVLGYKELKKIMLDKFNKAGIKELADIDWIMVEATGKQRSKLPFIDVFSTEEIKNIMEMLEQRIKHIPLAYITSKAYFYGYEFKVNKNVLIPRQDTEVLVEQIVKDIKNQNKKPKVLDIGTGSGAIAITIAKETSAMVFAVDISKDALSVAKQNAQNLQANVEFKQSDLFENVTEKFDYIVSNPPYIETDVINKLDDDVKLNEPMLALDGGTDGLDYYRKIIKQAPNFLNTNGKLYFEIGYNQAKDVSDLMQEHFKNIQVIKDYGNNDRVVIGELI